MRNDQVAAEVEVGTTSDGKVPEGYKKTKVGLIPLDWKYATIGRFAEKVGSGSTPRGGEKVYLDEGIPFIRSQNVTNDSLILSGVRCISEEVHAQMSGTRVLPGDLLLNITGASIGRSCIVPQWFKEGNVNQHVCIIRLNNRIESKYIQSFLSSFAGQKAILRSQVGGNREGLNHSNVRAIKIPLPPLPEQQKIAEILGTWDEAIQKCEETIAALKTRNKGLAQQLLSGKKRLNGFEGEWKGYSFEQLLKKVKRPVEWNDAELYKLISVRRRSGGIFYRDALYGNQIKVKNLHTAKAGDFLFSKMQIVHGASAMVTDEFDDAKISGSYIAVRSRKPELLNIEYLNLYSKLPLFYHQTYTSSYGVHIEKMTFDFQLFLKEKLSLPPVAEQTAIVKVLGDADRELQLYQQKLTTLKDQKKGLMQKLLTGEIRTISN